MNKLFITLSSINIRATAAATIYNCSIDGNKNDNNWDGEVDRPNIMMIMIMLMVMIIMRAMIKNMIMKGMMMVLLKIRHVSLKIEMDMVVPL